jgi:hypothetical protein
MIESLISTIEEALKENNEERLGEKRIIGK